MSCISSSSLAAMAGIAWYIVKTSSLSSPRLSTMYRKVWVWMASSKAWRRRYWRHSALVTWRKIARMRLLATRLSAVEKKPRLRMTTRRSSGVELVALPQGDIGAHRHFVRHPVVGAAVEVVLPGPLVLKRHELVDVDRFAVDQAFGVGDGVLWVNRVEVGEGEGHFDQTSITFNSTMTGRARSANQERFVGADRCVRPATNPSGTGWGTAFPTRNSLVGSRADTSVRPYQMNRGGCLDRRV